MKLSELLEHVNLPDLITRECGATAAHGLSRERGGVIRDPRSGHAETRPSFSVFLYEGRWGWKRHDGSDSQKGNAYGFLLSLGYSEAQAREELERLAGVPSSSWQPSGRSQIQSAPDPLEQAAIRALPQVGQVFGRDSHSGRERAPGPSVSSCVPHSHTTATRPAALPHAEA